MNTDKSRARTIAESELQAIIRRAIDLDAQSAERVSELTVREIARDLGVSDKAVEQALSEHRHAVLNTSTTTRWSLTPVWLGAAALGVGAVARAMRPQFNNGVHWESLVSSLVIVAVVSALALRPARRDAQRTFQSLNATTWVGYTVGWSLVHGDVWGDLLGFVFCLALGSSVIGGLITKMRARRLDSDGDVGAVGGHGEDSSSRFSPLRKLIRSIRERFVDRLPPGWGVQTSGIPITGRILREIAGSRYLHVR